VLESDEMIMKKTPKMEEGRRKAYFVAKQRKQIKDGE
jgi:hypothetical protein